MNTHSLFAANYSISNSYPVYFLSFFKFLLQHSIKAGFLNCEKLPEINTNFIKLYMLNIKRLPQGDFQSSGGSGCSSSLPVWSCCHRLDHFHCKKNILLGIIVKKILFNKKYHCIFGVFVL
jgi:hypothetical protein